MKGKVVIQNLERYSATFDQIGHPLRLQILLILHGSKYTHSSDQKCLKLDEIREVLQLDVESDEKLIYHINKLIDAGLVEKIPKKNERDEWDFPYYKVTSKWIEFADAFNITKIVEKCL